MSHLIADRRLYLTRDRRAVVEEGDPEGRYLLAPKGQPIEQAEVVRLGLRWQDGRVVWPGEKLRRAAENKMAAPPENKRRGGRSQDSDAAESSSSERIVDVNIPIDPPTERSDRAADDLSDDSGTASGR